MKVIIDSSSLHALVRYYKPFDLNNELENFIKRELSEGRLIVIDKVMEECKYLSKGVIIEHLDFLKDKNFLKEANLPYNTESIIPSSPAKFENLMDEQFVVQVQKRKIKESEFQKMKDDFYKSADLKMIMLCYNATNKRSNERFMIVTEETVAENDNKLFKKIPAICKILEIKTSTLPQFLSNFENVQFEFKQLSLPKT